MRYQEEALEHTHVWAKRSLTEHRKLCSKEKDSLVGSLSGSAEPALPLGSSASETPRNRTFSFAPALFGIVQGGRNENLRKKSAKFFAGLDFDGYGIGGSFAKVDMESAVRWVNEILPEEKPRHLLGIGEPEDIFMGVENGVDLFDCVLPTRNARNGTLYTKNGKINITNTQYKNDFSPIEADCECYTCKQDPSRDLPFAGEEDSVPLTRGTTGGFSRAYLSHLFHGKEMLAGTLATIHNLYFIVNLVKKIRQSILEDKFFDFKKEFLYNYLH